MVGLCCMFHLLHILFFIMWFITQLRANIPRCAAKIQIFSQTNVKMLRFSLYLQQFNVFSRLSATISPIIRCESKEIPHIMQANFVNAASTSQPVLALVYKMTMQNYIQYFKSPNLVCIFPILVCKHHVLYSTNAIKPHHILALLVKFS